MLRTIDNYITQIGQNLTPIIISLGRSFILMWNILFGRQGVPGLIKQIYALGVLSLPIIIVASFFIGMVLGLQGYYTLRNFSAEESLGVLVALSLTRELAPVLGAILFAGRSASSLTTEIGLMKTTEQLTALDLMGIDPIRYIFRPRLLAGLISLPVLVMIFIAVGILGTWFISIFYLGIDNGAFWSQMQDKVSWTKDVMSGMIKSVVFAIVVNWIALHLGNECTPTSEGVSKATTATVVYGSLWVLGLDFILTAIIFE